MLLLLCYCCHDVPLMRCFQQQLLSRPWSRFSSSTVSLREMCMASLISDVMSWLAWSRILVSSQRGCWCWDQACSAIADFSISPFLCMPGVLPNACPGPSSSPQLLPTTAGDLIDHSRCLQCRVSVFDSAQFPLES